MARQIVQEELLLNTKTVRITSLVDEDDPALRNTIDIEFGLTKEERNTLLRKLPDTKVNNNNASFIYLFQSNLAKYQSKTTLRLLELRKSSNANANLEIQKLTTMNRLMDCVHEFSSHFIKLEYFLNNATSKYGLTALLQEISALENNCRQTIATLRRLFLNREIAIITAQLEASLNNNFTSFRNQLRELERNIPSQQQLNCLMSVHDRDNRIQSLGNFIAEQSTCILSAGIEIAYEISNNRLGDMLQVPPAIMALSDAKAEINRKISFYSAEINDTYCKIPRAMLESLTTPTVDDKTKTQKWFSLKHYLNDSNWNPDEIDKIICLITDQPLSNKLEPSWWIYGTAKLGASVLETLYILLFRLPITLLLATIDITGSLIGALTGFSFFSPSPNEKWTNQIDQTLSEWHDLWSPVKAAKRAWNRNYRRLDAHSHELLGDDDTHQRLLMDNMKDSSAFQEIFVLFSPRRIAQVITRFFKSSWKSVKKIVHDALYLGSWFQHSHTPEQVYQTVKQRHLVLGEFLQALHTGCDFSFIPKTSYQDLDDDQRTDLELIEINGITDTKIVDTYPSPVLCVPNKIESPLEVIQDVMQTLSNTFIDPMFRKLPAPSAFFFAASALSLGIYLAPKPASALAQTIFNRIQAFPDWLSLHFTGKEASAGFVESLIATYLEWQFTAFPALAVIELQQGHYDFLAEIFNQPEQLTMGLFALVALGTLIQYIPLLPDYILLPNGQRATNIYAEIVNLIIEESKHCAEGTFPFNSFEFLFLGLKSAMLLHSMLSGHHHTETQINKALAIKELLLACNKEQLLAPETPQDQIENRFENIARPWNNVLEPNELNTFRELLLDSRKEYIDIRNKINGLRVYPVTQTQTNEVTLSELHTKLKEAMSMILDTENPLQLVKKDRSEPYKMYDYMHNLFKNYNHKLQRIGRADLCIDSTDFLAVFYNKYCHRGSNNLIRLLSIFPAYPLTITWRAIKWVGALLNNKPSVEHQVRKSFNKDLVILSQVAAIFISPLNALARSVSYALRPVVALSLFSITALPFLAYRAVTAAIAWYQTVPYEPSITIKSWLKQIDHMSCKLALHRVQIPQFFRSLYANAARIAGTCDEVSEIGAHIAGQLRVIDETDLENSSYLEINSEYLEPSSYEGQILERLAKSETAVRIKKPSDSKQCLNATYTNLDAELSHSWRISAHQLRGRLFHGKTQRPVTHENQPQAAAFPN